MDMSGTTTDNTTYTGAVCMSITIVGNTTDLPLSNPFRNSDSCLAFKIAHTASQANLSYYHQFDYGHYTIWYCLAVIGTGIIGHIFRKYRNLYPPSAIASSKNDLSHKIIALGRAAAYSSVGGSTAARFGMPRFGLLAFLIFSLLFFLLITFFKHPYYREHPGYGSPPLGVRAGLMSTALVPVIVALSGKVNIISFLTGIEHRQLNVLHRWASYLCLFLALVHTIPFIVIALKNCGSSGLHAQFYKQGSFEFTGIAPLSTLIGLALLSMPIIRNHFYNFFYRLHIPLYIVFLGTLFWHTGQVLDSWAYLWATLVLWTFSVLVRLFYKWQTFNVRRSWFSGMPATIQLLPGNMTRVRISVPADLNWKPGQHCFLRLPHFSMFQNHPFTIANLPAASEASKYIVSQNMDFYIRACHGLTLNLAEFALEREEKKQRKPLQVHIDGPYGGLVEDVPNLYQSLVCVVGGSGISACLPHIQHAAKRIQSGTSMISNVRLLWMIKQPAHAYWVLEELQNLNSALGTETLQIEFYITVANTSQEENIGQADEKDDYSAAHARYKAGKQEPNINVVDHTLALSDIGTVRKCRPYLPEVLPPLLSARRVMVIGCGPESLCLDLGNVTAKAQVQVLKGQADAISLHVERFSW